MSQGRPRRRKTRRLPTARGKRVPEAEINIQIVQAKKNCRPNHAYRSPQFVDGKHIFHQMMFSNQPSTPGYGF
ncbi:hypothetical protein RCO48_04900 [Peribacillus frigoritolerans]|nr:hypothetical protein [Peribacillus frigoritolerans]